MAIDASGKWWTGSEPVDVIAYLDAYSSQSYEIGPKGLAVCRCGSQVFQLFADSEEGAAKRVCAQCNETTFIADSEENWPNASPARWTCVECRSDLCNVGVGFATRGARFWLPALFGAKPHVRWVYVGCRCTKCHVLGCVAEWKIDYEPSAHLAKNI